MSESKNLNRIDHLVKRLRQRAGRTNFGSTLTLLVGLVAIGLLSLWFYWGYRGIDEITDPHKIVSYGEELLTTNLREARNAAADSIRTATPQWAADMSNELLNQMPKVREELQSQITGFLNTQFANADVITSDKFRQMITENKEEIQTAINTMLSNKDSSAVVETLMPIVENKLGMEIQNNAAEALGSFVDLNERLERLAAGQGLTELEQQQRYVLGLVQRLRVEETELQ
jgi:hypothetical protein